MSFKYNDEKLISKIKRQIQQLLEHDIKVVKQSEYKKYKIIYNAKIIVNKETYKEIEAAQKLNIGWEKYRVFDGTDIIMSFKCLIGEEFSNHNCWINAYKVIFQNNQLIIVAIYRSPNSSEVQFCQIFEEVIEEECEFPYNIIIADDFKIDWSKEETYKIYNQSMIIPE